MEQQRQVAIRAERDVIQVPHLVIALAIAGEPTTLPLVQLALDGPWPSEFQPDHVLAVAVEKAEKLHGFRGDRCWWASMAIDSWRDRLRRVGVPS